MTSYLKENGIQNLKKKKKSMEITWGETYSSDQAAGCAAEAGPEQPWASQQRSLQPAATPPILSSL